ncbi:hypothetical protein CUR178_08510 [Leishmania enriettii]|uniref:C2 domain-containing protein n=1 Tax=Leishmania enriettii TaxID=5663 RepID=A0A836H7U3_LEIEN|nr:hypothetical protein CUR178_08510 [Leishmania enriettii]
MLSPDHADPLLADLLLAEERTAYHRTVVTETTTTACEHSATHRGDAATSVLQLSVVSKLPLVLRQDAVDASAAAFARAAARTSATDGDGDRPKRKPNGKRRSSTVQRSPSRREQAHMARMAVALNPAFILPARERAAAARQADDDSISMSSQSSSSSSRVGGEGSAAALSASVFVQTQLRADSAEKMSGCAAADITAAKDEDAPEGYDYLPDGEDAQQVISRRICLLREQCSGEATVDEGDMCGTAALVRPSDRFHRGPVPAWVREYSDLLLFDRHHLDREVAESLRRSWVGSPWRCCCASIRAKGLVQLPVDAVVLRLRSDIARVRRLSGELRRNSSGSNSGIRSLVFPAMYPARLEVYRPAEQLWRAALRPPVGGGTAAAIGTAVQELAATDTDMVVGGNGGGDESALPAAPQSPPAALPPPPPPPATPLSRAVEAKDLQRPLLAQTIPVWRRHGAAATLTTELLDLLEDRLFAFEAQLDDSAQGKLLELAGAPESAGVDGTVQSTYPPALERAIRTTITSTMVSDIFATSWSALPNRGLRLSEARQRRQTPHIHADYVTVMDMRPVYDSTVLQTVQCRSSAAWLASPVLDAHQRHRWHSAGAAAVGVDARKSYSVHVDYVRFQPSLDSISGIGVLSAGFGAGGSAVMATTASMRTAGGGDASGHRLPSAPSGSEDLLSSLLLGSYSQLFLPRDINASGDGSTAGSRAVPLPQRPRRDGSLHSAASALLLALSMATAQHSLVAFSPEEYLTSLLLQYYEQYRLLQLNLLPVLKHRFFYEEQVKHLERQSHRNSNIDELLQRLQSLARTSADVERGCLHAMLVLWNSVLILRRQKQRQRQQCGAETLDEAIPDAPIIVEGERGSSSNSTHGERRQRRRCSESASCRGKEPTASAMAQGMRSHPLVFGTEVSTVAAASLGEDGVQDGDALTVVEPVVHRVDSSVTYESRVGRGIASTGAQQQRGSSRVSSPHSLLSLSGSPFAQSPTTARTAPAASANASPLLAPAARLSSEGAWGSGGSAENNGDGGAAQPPRPPPRRFRFFLRRYGTAEETSYVTGDDLLRYAAEVEGTDVLQGGGERGAGGGGGGAAAAAEDELMYFQVVVFTRSHAAMVPQYVGCTTPRPMTAAKVVFLNETFEVRTLHEPAELLLHLIPVTPGPAKHTVVSTVRLHPTLTRTYSLLPLQPPTAFAFRGRLFARHRRAAAGANGAAPSTTTATSVHGVVAVSTTWTSSRGMTVAQIERLFHGGGGSGGTAPDPLDPQYLPLLRTLRTYYEEHDMSRASGGGDAAPSLSRHWHSAGMTQRRGIAARGVALASAVHEDADSRLRHRRTHSRTRHSNTASTSQRRQHSTRRSADVPAGRVDKASPAALDRSRKNLKRFASTGQLLKSADGAAAGGAAAALRDPGGVHSTVLMLTAATGATGNGYGSRDNYAADATLQRLPSARLRHLHRRWLMHTDKLKAADEVEARLLSRAMPLNDADAYALQRNLKRSVDQEDVERVKGYGAAAGTLFNVKHYYSAPSAISGLPLSPLPRETKLKLWQERQRRRLLTLKARRHLTDAEKLEAVVRVPKLVLKLVFDFAPRSQLNPHRKMRPKTEDIDRALLARRRDSRIVIHIMKAHNLPLRADGTLLEPFVQASFVSEVAYTRSEVGSNPSWFQSLELPFQPLNFEEDTLGMIDDDVIISLYDKVEVKMAPSAAVVAAVAHETHYRTERRFIGTMHIPFYSLHEASQARMEGVYPLRMPRWILGYDTLLPYSDSAEGDPGRQCVLPRDGTASATTTAAASQNPFGTVECLPASGAEVALDTAAPPAAPRQRAPRTGSSSSDRQIIEPTLQLYMSLWPPLQREPPPALSRAELTRKVSEVNVSPELRYLHQAALKWQQAALKKVKAIGAMNAQASTRQIEPFVACSTGDLVLICRYILPHGGPPPPSVRTVYEAIRYVSLLPCVADTLSWREKSVWNTNAELLATRSSDCEELALLLTHFLRYLAPHRPTYAVIGSGTICQHTVMVLHAFDDAEWMLIDPGSGSTVPVGKPYGTMLRDIYAIVSHDQLWANVQLSGVPHRMAWDLANPAHWLPCFDGDKDARIAACTPHTCPIQREVLTFPAADPIKSREIELELRSCLKRALLTWRNGFPPAYHRGVETILRELLESAEAERCTCGSARRSSITLSAAARLSECFGENVTGESASSTRAAPHQQQHKRHRHHQHHHRRCDDSTRLQEGADEHAREESTAAAQPTTPIATVSARVSQLRLLGSPVMGSYNPYDPHFHELLQRVFECAVHEVGTSEASFAIGTYVKSYTGDVCAMWVYLVAICRR